MEEGVPPLSSMCVVKERAPPACLGHRPGHRPDHDKSRSAPSHLRRGVLVLVCVDVLVVVIHNLIVVATARVAVLVVVEA